MIGFKQVPGICRMLHSCSPLRAPNKPNAKKATQKLLSDKRKHKQNPELHPLYMDIPKALRYLRSAEIGEQATKSTISLLITVIPDKGSKPLSGFLKLPNPVVSSKLLIFSSDPIKLNIDESSYVIGGNDLVDQISKGEIDVSSFTHSFATTEFAPNLNRILRILGPKNLMCIPRKGNVVEAELLANEIENKMGTMPIKQKERHLSFPIARCDFTDKQVLENINAASKTIYSLEPAETKKGNLIGQTVISSTKGPGIVINFKA